MKFDMGRAWRDAVAMIRANREVMITIAGVFFFLPSLAGALLIPQMQPPMGDDPQQMEQFLVDFYTSNAPYFIIMGLIQAIGMIGLLALLRDDTKPTVGQALRTGLTGLLPYIGTQLIVGFAFALAALVAIGAPVAGGVPVAGLILGMLLVAAMVYVGIRLSLSLPVIAIEKVLNPISVLKRSWKLTGGSTLYLLAFYLLLLLAFLVILVVTRMLVGIPVALLGPTTLALIVNGIVSGIISAAATMVFAAILAAVHRQLAGPSSSRLGKTFE